MKSTSLNLGETPHTDSSGSILKEPRPEFQSTSAHIFGFLELEVFVYTIKCFVPPKDWLMLNLFCHIEKKGTLQNKLANHFHFYIP